MGLRPVAAATRIRRDELCTFLQARSLLYSKRAAILRSWNYRRAHSRSGVLSRRLPRLPLHVVKLRDWFSHIWKK